LIPDDRHYRLFGFLGGVRNRFCDPMFERRGIPEGTSATSDFYDCADHSHTYAYLDEILRAPWEDHDLEYTYFYTFCSQVLPRLLTNTGYLNNEEQANIRVVMGFDS
jgi:hypothetical protein